MEVIVLAIVFLVFFVGFLIGLGRWLYSYVIPEKLKSPKLGKFIVLGSVVIIAAIAVSIVFEDQLFTRNAARKLVAEQGIVLNDRFELVHNHSTTSWVATTRRTHYFVLVISDSDIKNVIETIKNSDDFDEPIRCLLDERLRYQSFGEEKTQNYETEEGIFIREHLKPSPSSRGIIRTIIHICTEKNKLLFERLEYDFTQRFLG